MVTAPEKQEVMKTRLKKRKNLITKSEETTKERETMKKISKKSREAPVNTEFQNKATDGKPNHKIWRAKDYTVTSTHNGERTGAHG